MIKPEHIKNSSGYEPVIFPEKSKLLVHICELGDQKTNGGLILTAKYTEEGAYKSTTGTLVSVVHATKEDEKIFSAKIGDKLSFRPYAGIHKVGKDCHAYRLLEGHEIHSIEL